MDVATEAAPAAAEPVVVPVVAPDVQESTPISPSEAGRQLAQWRLKQREQKTQEQAPAAPEPAAAEPQKSVEQTDAAPPSQDGPGEQTPQADPVEIPPIEPPRSWSKEDKELFASLPRETQERVAERERLRETDFSRRQNEAAEQRKAAEAERDKVEQARKQYEAALPALLQTLQDAQQGEFSDIKTMADVEKLSIEDPLRYIKWTAHQQKIGAIAQEVQKAQDRQLAEHKQKWNDFVQKQNQLLLDHVPELADKTRADKVADVAHSLLKDHGFTDQELGQLWHGESMLSLRDYRVQALIYDGVKFREAKTAIKPAPKPVPPVQRPGVSKATNAADDALQALRNTFDSRPTDKNAAAFLAARRRAAS